MAAYKDKAQNTWYTSFYYEDWTGERKRKLKRGFSTKKEALEWEREFQNQKNADLNMTLESFIEIYTNDLKDRLKEYTWHSKRSIIEQKILPMLGKKKMNEVKPGDIIQWQNELLKGYGSGKKYSQTYLKIINSQLNAIFNHAEKYYELKNNPAKKAGSVGTLKSAEMKFWTKDEYLKFADFMRDKPHLYCTFEILYWCGLRIGELLALTPADFDFAKGTVTVSKSYRKLNGKDIVSTPKTEKSNRTIKMPDFLCREIQEYLQTLYGVKPTDRIFQMSRTHLRHEMTIGAKAQGLQRIRIHDMRHSHISLLIDMGFSALAIADRVGHESINITYRYAHLFPSKQAEIADKLDAERMNGGEHI